MNIEELVGEVLAYVDIDPQNDIILLTTQSGRKVQIYHSQSCCESVSIETTEGEWRGMSRFHRASRHPRIATRGRIRILRSRLTERPSLAAGLASRTVITQKRLTLKKSRDRWRNRNEQPARRSYLGPLP